MSYAIANTDLQGVEASDTSSEDAVLLRLIASQLAPTIREDQNNIDEVKENGIRSA